MPEYDASGHLTTRDRKLQVKVPKGVTAGKRIRLPGQGAPGFNGGPAGDLFLEVQIRPHPLYEVDGSDVFLTLPVAPWEAALGAKVPVPTLGGKVDVTIPRGARSGQKLRLKGRGLPAPGGSGDQFVVLQIVTPPADSEQAKALYEQMARELAFDPRARLGGG